jgi:uracil-DNA glycosylase family 4
MASALRLLQHEIENCERCPRLRAWCRGVAQTKRRAYRDDEYWGRPVSGFGDPRARVFLLGLAPGAHGANRTGRVFTGDSSGGFLFAALHRAGFANQPSSLHRGDGLTLHDCWVSASVRCAPPDNKPTPREFDACRPYLLRELALLRRVQVVVALGRLAFDNYLDLIGVPRAAHAFTHGAHYPLRHRLVAAYHPSRQNTQTGRLTPDMYDRLFASIRASLA